MVLLVERLAVYGFGEPHLERTDIMGCASSIPDSNPAAIAMDKEINKMLHETKSKLQREVKLLLLGPGAVCSAGYVLTVSARSVTPSAV